MKKQIFILLAVIISFSACHTSETTSDEETPTAITPITLTNVSIEPIAEIREIRTYQFQ